MQKYVWLVVISFVLTASAVQAQGRGARRPVQQTVVGQSYGWGASGSGQWCPPPQARLPVVRSGGWGGGYYGGYYGDYDRRGPGIGGLMAAMAIQGAVIGLLNRPQVVVVQQAPHQYDPNYYAYGVAPPPVPAYAPQYGPVNYNPYIHQPQQVVQQPAQEEPVTVVVQHPANRLDRLADACKHQGGVPIINDTGVMVIGTTPPRGPNDLSFPPSEMVCTAYKSGDSWVFKRINYMGDGGHIDGKVKMDDTPICPEQDAAGILHLRNTCSGR